MREIRRLERLVLDAIEQADDPTLRGIVDYIAQRRRVWVWTHAGILVAVLRLEGEGRIEARRSNTIAGKVRWFYMLTAEEEHAGERCRACSSRSSST
jgi:hypothetical protein